MSDAIQPRQTVVPAAVGSGSDEDEVTYHDFLAFVLAGESYALPLSGVREIMKPPPITEVPRAPRDVLGIVSVRGRVTTVIDLRRRLRLDESGAGRYARILLADTGSEVVGLLVDRVLAVNRLSDEEVELASTVGGDMAEYVLGIGRPQIKSRRAGDRGSEDDEIIILLDPAALLKR